MPPRTGGGVGGRMRGNGCCGTETYSGKKPAEVSLGNNMKYDLKPVEKSDCSARYRHDWKDHRKLKETPNGFKFQG